MLSSVKNKIGSQEFQATLTTPQPDYLHMFFAQCVNAGVEYVVMEVAAQAFSLHRVAGIKFIGGIFTNFSQEHGEFYHTSSDYFAAKRSLLGHLAPNAVLVLNADDEQVASLAKQTGAVLVGQSAQATVQLSMLTSTLEGLTFTINVQHEKSLSLSCPSLVGSYNMYNMGMAAFFAHMLGCSWQSIVSSSLLFTGVSGRLERYKMPNGATCIIDYASNPASIEAVLSTLRCYTKHLIVISGAGGDRDREKRPIMGSLMGHFADVVIITTDNPRSEDPLAIIHDIIKGVADSDQAKVCIELDREQAIRRAYALSHKHSIIVLLGKGPDEYQLIQGKKLPFSERTIIQSFLLDASF